MPTVTVTRAEAPATVAGAPTEADRQSRGATGGGTFSKPTFLTSAPNVSASVCQPPFVTVIGPGGAVGCACPPGTEALDAGCIAYGTSGVPGTVVVVPTLSDIGIAALALALVAAAIVRLK